MGVTSIAELKVVEYILRHTWGFQEFGIKKCITTDEFMYGRKHQDGTRMDKGTGLSKPSVISGLQLALKHGFIEEEVDASDRARVKKYYNLRMFDGSENDLDVKSFDIGVKDFDSRGKNFRHRTEKETRERKNNVNVNEDLKTEREKQGSGMTSLSGILERNTTTNHIPIRNYRKKQKPDEIEKRDYLAQVMADELEDNKSLGAFRVIASKVQEQVIFEQLAGVKEIWREGKITQSRGALFVSFIQKYCDEHAIDLGFHWST